MRTIFITPLLWKKLNRSAIRRGEEGQAIVLIAFVAIGMVAMVGLAIDSGLGYLESTRMQRAADAAALAGVIWLPNNRTVGDTRAQLAAESNGIKVACYYNTGLADNSAYNQRCRRASYTKVTQNGPDQFYSFESEVPVGVNIRYRVTLSKMQTRFFLGVLGFPAYPIVRTATAEYFQRVIFGSSFNYYGSNGVMYDHYMRCDTPNMIDCDGNSNTSLNVRGATYSKYVTMRCEQPSPPSPCVGGFWGHIAGQDLVHTSGDAYNPIRDGGDTLASGSGINGKKVNTNSGLTSDCLHTNDPTTWFVNNIFSAPGSGCDDSTNPPKKNGDTHPDAPNGEKGFGSEVLIDVDQDAIWSYSETATSGNVQNHTNLNITLYDIAENDQGQNETYGTSDNYSLGGGNYANTPPYSGWGFQNVTSASSLSSGSWSSKTLICSPGTRSLANTGYCNSSSTLSSPSYPTAPRATGSDPTKVGDISTFFPDNNALELTYNDLRTRVTLYGPPPTPAIPSIYENVQAYKLGQMEVTDMSIRQRDVQAPIGCPQYNSISNQYDPTYGDPNRVIAGTSPGNSDDCTLKSPGPSPWDSSIVTGTNRNPPVKPYLYYEYQRYCYFIFDDTKVFWNNTEPAATVPNSGPDYAASTSNSLSRYAYVCPDNPANPYYSASPQGYYSGDTQNTLADVRWNQYKGTPTARYGSFATAYPDSKSISITNNATPIVTGTLIYTNTNPTVSSTGITLSITGVDLALYLADPEYQQTVLNASSSYNKFNIWDPITSTLPITSGTKTWQQVVDPGQDCRRSAIDRPTTGALNPSFPIDPMWGHNRIPFNMAYGDPLVNQAWSPTNYTTGYYTLYYSFHGWRCDWDFDSNYTADTINDVTGTFNGRGNPLLDPTKPPSTTNPSLSLKERLLWANTPTTFGKFDKAFVEGHPGLSNLTYSTNVLSSTTSPYSDKATPDNASRDFPVITNTTTPLKIGADKDYGLQPYFHLTNIAWDGSGSIIANPDLTANTAAVRPGAYLLHIQTFSGAGANRYSVKAEYENPKTITYTNSIGTLTVLPVPAVFPLTAMTIYANAVNSSSNSQQDVIFDLAYIPPSYAGTQAIVQLWDAGDISGSLDLIIREPSTYGPKINTAGSNNPKDSSGTFKWTVPLGNPITTTITACPYNLSQCVYSSSSSSSQVQSLTVNGNQYYNGQWLFLSFQLPSLSTYTTYKNACDVNGVPENLCYFYQIDYRLKNANARANDTTTWQLLVQGQPVHLVDNDD